MLGIYSIPLLFTILQAVSSQIPRHCMGPPRGVENPGDCCKIPPVFTDEDFKACDIENPRLQKPKGPPVCSKHVCLLKRYNLMKDDENIDREATMAYLDSWTEKNSEFKNAMEMSKEKCLSGDLPGPSHICEPNKVAFCIMITTFHECPTWEQNDNCKKLKEHMDECKPYLPF